MQLTLSPEAMFAGQYAVVNTPILDADLDVHVDVMAHFRPYTKANDGKPFDKLEAHTADWEKAEHRYVERMREELGKKGWPDVLAKGAIQLRTTLKAAAIPPPEEDED